MSEFNRRDSVRIGRPGWDLPDGFIEVDTCSIIGRRGDRCDAPVSDHTKVSICDFHAARVYRDLMKAMIRDDEDRRASQRAAAPPPSLSLSDSEERRRAASVVYYARNRGTIKIGRTTNLPQRLLQLRLDAKDLLAIEPGAFEVESRRIQQFAHLRIGRREDFRVGEDLVGHVKAIREQFGPPKIQRDPFGLLARLDASSLPS